MFDTEISSNCCSIGDTVPIALPNRRRLFFAFPKPDLLPLGSGVPYANLQFCFYQEIQSYQQSGHTLLVQLRRVRERIEADS